jgi:hypothetical protein
VRADKGPHSTVFAYQYMQDGRMVSPNTAHESLAEKTKTLTIRSVKEAALGDEVLYTFITVSKGRAWKRRGFSHFRNAGIIRPLLSQEVYLCVDFSIYSARTLHDGSRTFCGVCGYCRCPRDSRKPLRLTMQLTVLYLRTQLIIVREKSTMRLREGSKVLQ